MKDDADGDKKQQIHHIQNLYAFNLFCQKRFDDSMQVFAKLGTGEELVYVNFNICPITVVLETLTKCRLWKYTDLLLVDAFS